MSKKWISVLLILGLILIGGIVYLTANKQTEFAKTGFLMDTQVNIKVFDKLVDENVLEDAYQVMLNMDGLMNTYSDTSEITILNHYSNFDVSEDLYRVVRISKILSEQTNGAFDPTIKPLSSMWNFKSEYVPTNQEILEAKNKVGYKNIKLTEANYNIELLNGATLDIGGVAKGYAVDLSADLLMKNNVYNAIVDIGGNIKVIGPTNKEFYTMGIQDPKNSTGEIFAKLKLKNKSIATSGIYERNFTKNGEFYHHIIDPKTGKPTVNGVISATVITDYALNADAYATALVVMGKDEAIKFINNTPNTECVIVMEDNSVYLSSGISNEDFEITNKNYIIKE